MQNAKLDEVQAVIKIARRSINNLRYAHDPTLVAESHKESLDKVKEESEKGSLKFNIQKLRSWHLVPSLHGKQMGKQWKQLQTLFFGAPKSLQMVPAAMKFKNACSLEEKLGHTQTAYSKPERDITLPTNVCLIKAMDFPVVMYRCQSWTIKKAEC